jgi:hypothetical protein
MRRLLTWLGVAAGALLVFRGLFRRRRRTPAPETAGDPAEELKRKLAESRTDDEAPAPEPESGTPQPSLDERRRAVHDKARAAIDDMLGGEQADDSVSSEEQV